MKQTPGRSHLKSKNIPVSALIPYACHYNKNIIITKTGALLQTIKISSFAEELCNKNILDFRNIIREVVLKHVKDPNFAIYFSTIRTKRDIVLKTNYDNLFAKDLREAWVKKNYWHDKYVNELYITLIYDSELHFGISSLEDLISSTNFQVLRETTNSKLKNACEILTEIAGKIYQDLLPYGAKLLGVTETENGSYSDYLKFFNKLIQLEEKDHLMNFLDFSELLSKFNVVFGNYQFELRNETNKSFGAIFSIKEYQEVSSDMLDDFLQIPIELVVTQMITFGVNKKFFSDLKSIKEATIAGKDQDLLALRMKQHPQDASHFINQHITIQITSNNLKRLESSVQRVYEDLSKIGFAFIQEDLQLENCFWAQLPGNFSFQNRSSPVLKDYIGGLTSLRGFSVGRTINIWGSAVSIFRTAKGNPYYFNFHIEQNGHTALVTNIFSEQTRLVNFLLSESTKYKPQIMILDQNYQSEIFTQTLGGTYHYQLKFNPLELANNKDNREFLINWLEILIDEPHAACQNIVDNLYALPPEARNFKNLVAGLKEELQIKFADFYDQGKFAYLFDNESNLIEPNVKINGFDLTDLMNEPKALYPTVFYLMHKFEQILDGNAAIFTAYDTLNYFNHPKFVEILPRWFKKLTDKKAISILGLDLRRASIYETLVQLIIKETVTHLLFADKEISSYYRNLFSLSKEEYDNFCRMRKINRHFMIKQNNVNEVVEISLAGIPNLPAIIEADPDTTVLARTIIEEHGKDPKIWLPILYSKLNNI